MILVALVLLAGGGQLTSASTPTFTEADVAAIEACADRFDNRGECPGSTADNTTAIDCMTGLPDDSDDDDLKACLRRGMEQCSFSYNSTTPEMDQRALRVCSARSRGATQAAIANWFVRAEQRLPRRLYEEYELLYGTVPLRAQAAALSATATPTVSPPLSAAAARTGVWESFAIFLWRSERDED